MKNAPSWIESRSLLFMKVGDHAGETWEQILDRKRRELDAAGKIFWGYGGSACHPLTQVQPFVKAEIESGRPPSLLMQSIRSIHDHDIYPAVEYSIDGVEWEQIPDGVRVTGSRYAMILGEINEGDFMIDPRRFAVGIGPSRGKRADKYLSGRTDKACLIPATPSVELPPDPESAKKIDFFGRLVAPYAVLLR